MAMSPTIPTILAAVALEVKTAMNPTFANVTTVHTKRRFWRDDLKFNALFKRVSPDLLPGRVNGWIIYRDATRAEESDHRWRFWSIHKIALEGYMAVNDGDATADQSAFDAQIEAIRDRLRLNVSVFGNTEKTLPDTQVEQSSEPVLIGNVTAWYARLSLEVEAVEVKSL